MYNLEVTSLWTRFSNVILGQYISKSVIVGKKGAHIDLPHL